MTDESSFPPEPARPTEKDQPGGLDRLVRHDEDQIQRPLQSRRRSMLVRKLRLLLPLAALAIIVVMFAWSDMDKIVTAVPKKDIAPQAVGKNELINPKFQSEDSSQQPYTITATKAYQKSDNLDHVILDKPVADINLKGGAWVAVESKDGEYTQSSGALKLDGNVKVFHDSGYELHTNHMDIDIKNQTLSSQSPVTGHGPNADIEATGLQGTGNQNVLVFTGPAKLTLRPGTNAETKTGGETGPVAKPPSPTSIHKPLPVPSPAPVQEPKP